MYEHVGRLTAESEHVGQLTAVCEHVGRLTAVSEHVGRLTAVSEHVGQSVLEVFIVITIWQTAFQVRAVHFRLQEYTFSLCHIFVREGDILYLPYFI